MDEIAKIKTSDEDIAEDKLVKVLSSRMNFDVHYWNQFIVLITIKIIDDEKFEIILENNIKKKTIVYEFIGSDEENDSRWIMNFELIEEKDIFEEEDKEEENNKFKEGLLKFKYEPDDSEEYIEIIENKIENVSKKRKFDGENKKVSKKQKTSEKQKNLENQKNLNENSVDFENETMKDPDELEKVNFDDLITKENCSTAISVSDITKVAEDLGNHNINVLETILFNKN